MELSGFEYLIYGFISGLAEVFPISARAHKIILMKVLGVENISNISGLFIHIAVLAAAYLSCRGYLNKMRRARSLARVPKKRRKRPLDVCSLMDSRFLITMILPVVLMMLFGNKIFSASFSLIAISALLLANGFLMYIPQFFPGCNKDARSLSRKEAIFMGLGGGLSIVPGISGLGASVSIGSICGLDRGYALSMSLMMNMAYWAGMIVYDIANIIRYGLGILSFQWFIVYIFMMALTFVGATLAIRVMRILASEKGYHVFSYYCWGIALFAFVLNLMA
jgi:undecaprenyl-diphosphatase